MEVDMAEAASKGRLEQVGGQRRCPLTFWPTVTVVLNHNARLPA